MLAPKPDPLMFPSPLAATTAATPYTTDVMEPALRAWLAAITVVVLLGGLFVFLRYWRQAYKTRTVWTISIAITALSRARCRRHLDRRRRHARRLERGTSAPLTGQRRRGAASNSGG